MQDSDSTSTLGATKHGHGNRAGILAQNAPDDSILPLIHVSDESHTGESGCEGLALRLKPEQDRGSTLPARKYSQTIWPPKTYRKLSMDASPDVLDRKKPMQDTDFDSPVGVSLTGGSRVTVLQGRSQWVRILIITVAFYSTMMSGLWFAVAARRPWWGSYISSTSFVGLDNISTVCALLAKSIEITFVTTFVAYLGQQLTRKAGSRKSQGISIADMSIKSWVLQPGSMVSHWASFRIAAISTTGLVTFLATWSVMLYTSASNALGNCSFKSFV